MNDRSKLKAAIETRQAADDLQKRAREALASAGEYLKTVESELTALRARNQSEIVAHGKSLIASFRSGGLGAAPDLSETASLLVASERRYAAAAAAYAELENEFEQTHTAVAAASAVVRSEAAATLCAESDDIATQIFDGQRKIGELREQLKALGAISSGLAPSEKLRVLSIRAVEALDPKGDPFVARDQHRDNATAWRNHFDALQSDPEHLIYETEATF